MNRQNSSPQIGRSVEQRRTPGTRSKTPPPKFETPQYANPSQTIVPQQKVPFTVPRSFPRKPSNEGSSASGKSKSSKSSASQEPSKETIMDIKYNLYCQTALMTLHAKSVMERNQTKTIKEMEQLQMSQLEMEEKMSALDANLEKIRFLKKTKKNFQEKNESYDKIIESVDESKLDEQIRMLEEDLAFVQLANFNLPKNEEETKEVLQSIENIDKELSQIAELQRRIAPLTQLHSSWLEVKRNVQKEEELKTVCEKELKTAEELVYDYCFKKSFELEKLAKK